MWKGHTVASGGLCLLGTGLCAASKGPPFSAYVLLYLERDPAPQAYQLLSNLQDTRREAVAVEVVWSSQNVCSLQIGASE